MGWQKPLELEIQDEAYRQKVECENLRQKRLDPFSMQYGGFVYVWAFCKKCWRWHRKSSKIAQKHRAYWMSEEEVYEWRKRFFIERKRKEETKNDYYL